jgi:flagellar motor switch protein FliM
MGGFKFSVAMGNGHAGVALWFPDHELQSLSHTLFPSSAQGAAPADGVWGHQIRRKLEGAQVELSAEFAEFQLSIAELISLQRGDIIPIGKPKDITAKVGDRAVFSCGFGVSQGRHAIRIEQKLTEFSSLSDLQGTGNSHNQHLSGDQNG